MAREMKESGVEWIGAIPKTWTAKKLKYCASIQSGYPFDSAYFSNSKGFPLVRIRDITSGTVETYYTGQYDSAYIVNNGDLLVGMDGDFNTRWWMAGDALLNQRCCKVLAKQHYEKRYLYYCLPLLLERINDLTYSTTVKHLSTGDIGNASIPNIPEYKQKLIAGYLDKECSRIDSVIEQTRASIEEYKKLKQAVITQAVTKGIRPGRAMKDSGIEWIGEIPQHWELKRIKNITVQSKDGIKIGPFGSALTNKTQDKGDYNVYSQANLIAADYSVTKNTIDAETFYNLQAYEVYPGDICLSMMGTIGKCKMVPSGIKRGIMDSHLIKIRLSDSINSSFFEYVYDKDLGGICFQQMQFDKKGFIMDGLNTTIVKNLYFPVPSKKEQGEIVDYLDEKCVVLDGLIQRKQSLLSDLESYKKSLIYEYVTGKKEVPACQ